MNAFLIIDCLGVVSAIIKAESSNKALEINRGNYKRKPARGTYFAIDADHAKEFRKNINKQLKKN